ncbi:MAG TPA: Hsp70 family protein, partial [Dongiaceae bacterium]|nr:Hsp70 family protein [Dongiaceae bacterium]
MSSRYSVGIDLGTTNSVVASVDLQSDADAPAVQLLTIPQLTQPGVVESRSQLPSFLYLPHESEVAPQELVLPWDNSPTALAGAIARQLGGKTPLRLVASAKSWLCHGGVDRHSALLPLNAPEEVAKVSPVQASVAYLAHVKAAWDHQHPESPLEQQEVTLTVPASFDPAARDLTVEAARAIGLQNLI